MIGDMQKWTPNVFKLLLSMLEKYIEKKTEKIGRLVSGEIHGVNYEKVVIRLEELASLEKTRC